MRRIVASLIMLSVLAGAGSLDAAGGLKSAMRTWKADAAALDRMELGSVVFDEAEAIRLLQGFVDQSSALASSASGRGAEAADIKARFLTFGADAQSTIEALRSGDRAKARYSQLRAQCRSCHDLYRN